MKPHVDLVEREAKRKARMAMPNRREMHGKLVEHQRERARLEARIEALGFQHRSRGIERPAELRKARAALDALNAAIYLQRKAMRGD